MEEIFKTSTELLDTGEKTEDDQPTSEPQNTSDSSYSIKNENNVLTRFRAIVTEYLNGDVVDNIDSLTKGVLGSYSMAGYLDFALPSGKEIIITKLLQQCCFLLQDLLRYVISIDELPGTIFYLKYCFCLQSFRQYLLCS